MVTFDPILQSLHGRIGPERNCRIFMVLLYLLLYVCDLYVVVYYIEALAYIFSTETRGKPELC